ncbi:MAG TPA: alkaline phosphatase family protein [Terracidiphilus sp.]|nr:alkaline phosphatase family protein [Terracidiphilus sp.]
MFGSATVTVTGTLPTITNFTVSPVSFVGSGGTATLTVTLSAAALAGGATISLTTSNSTVFPVPVSFTVPAGQTTGSQTVTVGTVTASTLVTVTASYNSSSKSLVIPFVTAAMPIQHVVVIMQENRSFDNLFNGFPGADTVQAGIYLGTSVSLQVTPLGNGPSPDHTHPIWWQEWDGGLMDNFNDEGNMIPYSYISPTETVPYWTLASNFTLGDRMFQSNTGPSFVAHQYMIAGQSDQTSEDPSNSVWGCDSPAGTTVALVGPNGTDLPGIYPCFNYMTLGDLLDAKSISWRYYAPGAVSGDEGFEWSAYQAISQIYFGPDWTGNVISPETQVLTDIANGKLAQVTWVIPAFNNSDHAGSPAQGPDWVASVVNAIGQSPFWNSTAIFISWDDWGGWYDHVPPPQVDNMGFGFRVPVIVVSPFAKHGYISHVNHTSAGFLRYTEEVFGLPTLGTRDNGADDFNDCFDYTQTPVPYVPVKTNHTVTFFLEQKPSGPPDDD